MRAQVLAEQVGDNGSLLQLGNHDKRLSNEIMVIMKLEAGLLISRKTFKADLAGYLKKALGRKQEARP